MPDAIIAPEMPLARKRGARTFFIGSSFEATFVSIVVKADTPCRNYLRFPAGSSEESRWQII